jgi:hypothetical protein
VQKGRILTELVELVGLGFGDLTIASAMIDRIVHHAT